MRRGGAIPPGMAGLVVLAAAAVPLAVRNAKPLVRWIGKKLHDAGCQFEKMADEVERYEREKTERERTTAARTESASTGESTVRSEPAEASEPTASPHSQAEMEAQQTASATGEAAKPKAPKRKPKQPFEGATPPANNAKTRRRKAQ